MALLPTVATVEAIRTTVEVVDKPKTEARMKKLLCVPILRMALLLALGPAYPAPAAGNKRLEVCSWWTWVLGSNGRVMERFP